MSQKNVDQLYREILDAWNRGDVEYIVDRAADDVVIDTTLAGVEGSHNFRGHEGIRRWWSEYHDVFPDWHAELLTLRAIGESTVAELRVTGHGRGSGAPVDWTMWHVVHWRDGKSTHISPHDTEAEALEAVGLSE